MSNTSEQRFYRFMLAFDGIPQGVGVFQGLTDTGLSKASQNAFYKAFDCLESPELEDAEYPEFWFTELGLDTFHQVLDDLAAKLEPLGWSLMGGVMEDDMSQTIYSDPFQVAWEVEYLETDETSFVEIHHVLDLRKASVD